MNFKHKYCFYVKTVFVSLIFLTNYHLGAQETNVHDSAFYKPQHKISVMFAYERLYQNTPDNKIELPISAGMQFQYSYIYNFNFKWALTAGLSIGWHNVRFWYSGNYADNVATKIFTAALPVNIMYRFKLKHRKILSVFAGVNVNSTLAGDMEQSASVITDTGYVEIYTAVYNTNPKPQWGLNFGISYAKLMNNNSSIELGLSANINYSNVVTINYVLYPEIDAIKSSGNIYGRTSYIGLKIAYIFSGKNNTSKNY